MNLKKKYNLPYNSYDIPRAAGPREVIRMFEIVLENQEALAKLIISITDKQTTPPSPEGDKKEKNEKG